jgi:hypothetical protein
MDICAGVVPYSYFVQLGSSHRTATTQKWPNEQAPLLIRWGAAKNPEYAAFCIVPLVYQNTQV